MKSLWLVTGFCRVSRLGWLLKQIQNTSVETISNCRLQTWPYKFMLGHIHERQYAMNTFLDMIRGLRETSNKYSKLLLVIAYKFPVATNSLTQKVESLWYCK